MLRRNRGDYARVLFHFAHEAADAHAHPAFRAPSSCEGGNASLPGMGKPQARMQTPDAQARHLAPAMWLFGAPSALSRGKFGAFRRDLARSRDVLSAPGERWLALGALLDAGRFTLVGLSRGRSASGQSTDDIEWNGEPIG